MGLATAAKLSGTGNVMSMMRLWRRKKNIGACGGTQCGHAGNRRRHRMAAPTLGQWDGQRLLLPGPALCMRRRPGRSLPYADQGAIRPAEALRPTKPATSRPHPAVLRGVQCSCVGHAPDCTRRGNACKIVGSGDGGVIGMRPVLPGCRSWSGWHEISGVRGPGRGLPGPS